MSESSYDAIPYTSYPYERTHPDRLATVGGLFGVRPTPPATARILEIGCASGGNLLPMAEQLPGAELVGIDLSERQIDVGRSAIDATGLTNVRLQVLDLADIDEAFGSFDYILCHGVLSWVSEAMRERIFEVFAQRLAPQGVGIVSYNTYPGWHMRQAVREMMLFHVAQFSEPKQRAEQAKALLDFVVAHGPSARPGGNEGFSGLMKREAELLRRLPDDYLVHEHLEEHNTPLYFHALEARLRAHGLAYVGDADIATMMTSPLSAEAAEQLERISPDLVRLEQYLDFVRGRQFRSTILCRGDVALSRNLSGEQVQELFVSCATPPAGREPVDLRPGVTHAFKCGPTTLRSDVPITKAALAEVQARSPASVGFGVLLAEARQTLMQAGVGRGDKDTEELSADVLRCYLGGGLTLRTEAPSFVAHAGRTPTASAYARWQAAHCDFATNRLHARVELDTASRAVVELLDGNRDRAGIIAGLSERVADGRLSLSQDDAALTDPAQWAAPLGVVLDHTLPALARGALLLA